MKKVKIALPAMIVFLFLSVFFLLWREWTKPLSQELMAEIQSTEIDFQKEIMRGRISEHLKFVVCPKNSIGIERFVPFLRSSQIHIWEYTQRIITIVLFRRQKKETVTWIVLPVKIKRDGKKKFLDRPGVWFVCTGPVKFEKRGFPLNFAQTKLNSPAMALINEAIATRNNPQHCR